jgi:hypothetical protein
MGMWDRSDSRKDVHTAARIDHGVAVQNIAGSAAAFSYLIQCGIPATMARRVLSVPRGRRQLGAISLAPLRVTESPSRS